MSGNEPILGVDRLGKDQSLVNKLNILANAMNQIPDKPHLTQKAGMFRGPIGQIEQSEEQRITLSELPKILFLNNSNPTLYNL